MNRSGWVLLLAAAACHPDDPAPTDGDGTITTDDTGTPPPTLTEPPPTEPIACDPPLAIQPGDVGVDANALVQFTAAGGTGHAIWTLAEPAQGSISRDFGSYLAPGEIGVTDTVILEDANCEGQATATVTVGDPFTVLPVNATVLPGTAFSFQISGGSGQYACDRATDGSGGSLAGCAYTAGPTAGVDVIEVSDTGTGEVVSASVVVDPAATWTLEGTGGLFVPVGATFAPRAEGGSGVIDVTVQTGPFTAVDGGFVADGAGPGRVRIRDRFAGFEATVRAVGVPARVPPSLWFGEQSLQGRAAWAGDLDGDGYDDAVLGFLEANVAAWYGGVAAVWRGGPNGLQPEPSWVAAGSGSESYLGRSLLVQDIDGDGQADLLVGADGDDVGASNVGSVTVWRGVPGGTFEPLPWKIFRGVYGGDRFGGSLGACDVDGDGITDLAVGAWAHEDRSGDTYPNDTGALMLFRGFLDRDGNPDWPESPTVIRYGAHLDGLGGWAAQASSQMGLLGMATGDVDGDGDCDIAIATYGDGVYGDTAAYGYVNLFEGLPTTEGTLSAGPTRTWANLTDNNANFGRELAMGDVDGDGLADLLVGAWAWDGRSGSSGGAFLYLGASWDGRPATDPMEPTEADWYVSGREGSDYLGNDVDLRDLDGDGLDDVLVGVPRGEIDAGVANAGAVLAWSGADIASAGAHHDGTDDPRLLEVGGEVAESFFGQAAAAVGDADGDGVLDVLVLEGRTDDEGLDVARAVAVAEDGVRTELDLPGEPAGNDHGRGVTLHDADGDGVADLVVGSPQDADVTKGLFSGSVWAFRGAGDGSFAATATELGGVHPDLSSSDRAGFAVADLDFDGDGRHDLAVAARTDSRPSSFGSHIVNPTECPGSIGSAGSVAIFRGSAAGTSDTPAFLFYGPDASANVRLLATGFDHDGDGLDDLLVGGRDWQVEGGVGIVHGRAADPGGTTVICDDERWYGLASGDWFGESIAVLHDLDGDGCDEVAVGAPREDLVLANQGVVRILWGYGPTCAPGPRVTALAPGLVSAGVGAGLAGGADVDGDELDDLVVGSIDWRVNNERLGGVWLVPGAWIRSLPKQSAPGGVLPDAATTVLQPLVPPIGHWGVVGAVPGGRFGQSLALLPDPGSARSWIVAGTPDGDEGGTLFAGGLRVHRFVPDVGDGQPGLETVPYLVVGGETHLPGGDLGETVGAGRVGGRSLLWFGAPASSQGGLAVGGAYAVPVEAP
ncbi:MAG: FG-GAP repeat protein [Alphaproteobacteria bacterium]|nr:FG-GAP repeat protein [Alphaproteobacteria bacterium]